MSEGERRGNYWGTESISDDLKSQRGVNYICLLYTSRQENQKSDSYWQEFEFDGSKNSSVANVRKELNSRTPLRDESGNIVTTISWECSCMVRKCGACAMLINERPRLACSTFLHQIFSPVYKAGECMTGRKKEAGNVGEILTIGL